MLPTYTISSNYWPKLSSYIIWIKENRDELKDNPTNNRIREGINHSIILSSACFIEGLLDALLKHILPTLDSFSDEKKKERKCEITYANSIEKYNHLCKEILKIDPNKKMNESWKAFKHLLDLRNILAHGRSIEKAGETRNFQELDYYQNKTIKLQNYLVIEKKIMNLSKENLVMPDFLSSDIADFFWKETKAFIRNLENHLEGNSKSSFKFLTSTIEVD